MKKFLSMFLTLLMLCCMIIPTFSAETTAESRSSNYFSNYGATLSAEEDGVIKIVFSTTGMQISNSIGVATYEVQRLNDNGVWENVSGLLNGQTGSNVLSYTFSRYFQGVPGETYRAEVVFFCSRNDGSEHKTYTSGRITAKR